MIRINLLAVERERTKRKATFQLAEKITVACSLILVAAGVFIGWWYWTLSREAADLQRQMEAAQTETARLKVIIQKVEKAEQRRKQLEERVSLIEQLRKGQAASVHLLDEISRNLPDNMWLTNLQQKGSDVTIEGRCLMITAVADLMTNLQASGYFNKSMDAPTIDTEKGGDQSAPEIVRFSLKVQYAVPGSQPAATTAASPQGAAGPGGAVPPPVLLVK